MCLVVGREVMVRQSDARGVKRCECWKNESEV